MCVPLAIVGGIVSGIGSAMSAMMAAQSANAQAALQERQARTERQAGAYEAQMADRKADRIAGAARAGGVASGVDITTGSEYDVSMDSALEAQRDIDAIRWNAASRADTLKYEAQISRMNAKNNKVGAVFGFLSPVIEGVAKYRSQFA